MSITATITLVLPVSRSQAAGMPIFGSAQSSPYSGSFGTTAASRSKFGSA